MIAKASITNAPIIRPPFYPCSRPVRGTIPSPKYRQQSMRLLANTGRVLIVNQHRARRMPFYISTGRGLRNQHEFSVDTGFSVDATCFCR